MKRFWKTFYTFVIYENIIFRLDARKSILLNLITYKCTNKYIKKTTKYGILLWCNY